MIDQILAARKLIKEELRFKSVQDLFVRLKETGCTGMDQTVFTRVRKELEDTIGLEEYYRIQEQTVEKRQ